MDNSLLAVRDINHKYIVVERTKRNEKRLWKAMVSLTVSAALLLPATTALAGTKQTTENGIAVTAEADENGFVIEDGVLIEYTGTAEEVDIPDGVTSIGAYAFYGCPNLTIYGKAGSYTETYAGENNIPFVVALFTGDFDIDMGQTDFTYIKESSEGAVIKCSGDFADFENVYVDDTLIDKTNYELKEGSTIIIFKQEFMDTLEDGEHTFRLEYKDNKEVEVFMTITTLVIGDVDGDGFVNVNDALEILKIVVGLIELDDNAKKAADVNGDNVINVNDALDVLKKVVGLIDKFAVETSV